MTNYRNGQSRRRASARRRPPPSPGITPHSPTDDRNAQFWNIVDSAHDALLTSALDGTIVTWNSGAQRLCGYGAAEAVGRPVTMLLTPERGVEWDAVIARIGRAELPEPFDTVCVRKDGVQVDVSWSVSPLTDRHGKLVGASALGHDITAHKRTAADLRSALAQLTESQITEQNSRAQLRDFAGRLRAASEKERSFIAREIHDELGQALTALKMDVFSLRSGLPVSARAQVEPQTREMADLIDVMIDKVRTLAAELRPAVLDNLGLAAAVEWAVQQFARRTGIRCELDLPADPPTIDADRSIDVFRILQEALANVARHAEASSVEVCLRVTPGELVLEVHDNGRGIRPNEIESAAAFGLLGMRERALLWGGEIGIRAVPQGGTCAIVCIPLAHGASEVVA
jgi:two-component system sensor histidine kinase UhpB